MASAAKFVAPIASVGGNEEVALGAGVFRVVGACNVITHGGANECASEDFDGNCEPGAFRPTEWKDCPIEGRFGAGRRLAVRVESDVFREGLAGLFHVQDGPRAMTDIDMSRLNGGSVGNPIAIGLVPSTGPAPQWGALLAR